MSRGLSGGLSGASAAGFCRRPDRSAVAALLHGPDAALLAVRRDDLVAALAAEGGGEITRLDPETLRRDPAALDEALRARGFFGGRPVVVVDRAKDGLAPVIAAALGGLTPEDGFLIVTAESLPKKSALRSLFESADHAAALAFWPEPPDGAELARLLAAEGCGARLGPDAQARLAEVAAGIDAGSLRQLLARLALYAADMPAIGAAEVEAVAPATLTAEADRLMDALAEGRAQAVGPLLARLAAAGTEPARAVTLAGRHFLTLLALLAGTHPARMPPLGMRRDALAAQARRIGRGRLEEACRLALAAEAQLRAGGGPRPARAIAERCLLRIAMMTGGPGG